jgi:hypothetical protein
MSEGVEKRGYCDVEGKSICVELASLLSDLLVPIRMVV